MLTQTLLTGGHLIDPASDADQVADLCLRDGRIVARTNADCADSHEIDVSGCVVMAGGIDLHTHIGGGKISLARMLLHDQMPTGQTPQSEFLPSAAVAAERYLDMGYTTCFEPAVIPCNARSAHAEMADVAGIDTGGYCLLGNDDVLLQLIAAKTPQEIINDYVAWMVTATQCIAVKVVNPGGISAFKFNARNFDVDTPHPQYGVTPGQVIRTLCRAVHEIGLAHPLHVHCSNLGVPGNIDSTLATIRAADGLPIHLTHAQFHCYGKHEKLGMTSQAHLLVEAMAENPNVTIDVGQVMFGQTVTISADTMHQYDNRPFATPKKSALVDVECEAGCGVVPFKYRRRQFVHSLQWAIGLELFLTIDDPSRVFLTTDHPNGAPFTTYPHLIRLLGDHSFRATALAEINADAAASSQLGGLDREYSLSEFATMTRSAPANILGLRDIGSLAAGSHADVVVYERHENLDTMFRRPRFVFRRGRLIRSTDAAVPVDDGTNGTGAAKPMGSVTHAAELKFDPANVVHFAGKFESESLYRMDHLRISDDEMEGVIGSKVERHQGGRRER